MIPLPEPGFTPAALAALLDEANHGPQFSVQAALNLISLDLIGVQPHPRVAAITAHLSATKRELWTFIAAATGAPPPPDDAGLTRLMAWEVQAAASLPVHTLSVPVPRGHGEAALSTAETLRLNARHAAWHAGKIADLVPRVRLA